ncbi:ATP-dependent DNA/RNA helicase [Chytridiales sp. JEL 0842]|nr:ATP-dependent DNA/RNA helicase [Chytridiales sp. JEL 0842]
MAEPAPKIPSSLLDTSKGFSSLELDPRLLRALAKMGFTQPTLVQSTAIPLALAGKDILARARTGSGKTIAYCLPVIHKILNLKENSQLDGPEATKATRALLLVPTRELCEQVTSVVQSLTKYASREVTIANVGTTDVSLNQQRPILQEKPDIIVSTPSRILAHMEAGNIDLKETLDSLVIDEADLILSYGYDEDLRKLLTFLPRIYQSYLMSATLSSDVQQLKQLMLRNPAILKLEEGENGVGPDGEDLLTQYQVRCSDQEKFLLTYFLLKLRIHPFGNGKTIIFVNDIDRCYKVKLFLEQFGIRCCTLNSELPLKSRYHIVQEFNRGIYDIIIATDEGGQLHGEVDSDDEAAEATTKSGEEVETPVAEEEEEPTETSEQAEEETASKKRPSTTPLPPSKKAKSQKQPKHQKDASYGVSRGIDFQNVQAVINFDLPTSSKSYTHRIGRTARGVGNKGWALNFVVPTEEAPVLKGDGEKILPGMFDEDVFERIVKRQEELGRKILPFTFDSTQTQAFQYRVADALKAVTKTAIREARLKEIKQEILNSEKLKAHFEDNPHDLQALRHDKPLHPSRVQSHLKHVPDYLMPKRNLTGPSVEGGHVPFRMETRKKRGGGAGRGRGGGKKVGGGGGRKGDPLKSFTSKKK